MNYERIYFEYMAYCKALNRQGTDGHYYEKHHIAPKSLFPERKDDQENLVLLTAREHYLAHLTLCKVFEQRGDKSSYNKMICALALMSKIDRYRKFRSAREYSQLREKAAQESSVRQKGKKLSEEHRRHLSESSAWKGRASPMSGKTHSDAAKRKNAQAHQGKKAWNAGITGVYVCSDTTREKLSRACKGRKMSDEAKKAISDANRGRKYYYSSVTGERRKFYPGTQPSEFIPLRAFKKTSLYKGVSNNAQD